MQPFFRISQTMDWKSPVYIEGGRTFRVAWARVRRVEDFAIWRRCEIEVQSTDSEVLLEFHVNFYKSIFARGAMPSEDDETLLCFARRWVRDYLIENRQLVSFSRCCWPVIIDCR